VAKPKLVIVDKSDIIINWVKTALSEDYDVIGVTSAMEASGVVVREEPAVVLIDPAMPIVGQDVVPLVRDALGTRRALVVLFSGQPLVELAEKARELEAHAYIEKSGDAHTFASRIRSLNLPTEVWAPNAIITHAVPPRGAAPPAPKMDGKTILVAGRNWLTHGTLLPRAGFSMSAVANAKAVQDSLRTWKPALLVAGPNLPDATVPEMCRAIRAGPTMRQVSILFVGEPYDHARAQHAREAGANETLLRPLDEMTLFQAVGRLTNVSARRKARLLVRIDLKLEQGGTFCVGFTHNVSASGMLLETDRHLELNQPMTVRFFVPGCVEEIEALVNVVRVQTHRDDNSVVGVQFAKLDDRLSEAIDEFVHAQSG